MTVDSSQIYYLLCLYIVRILLLHCILTNCSNRILVETRPLLVQSTTPPSVTMQYAGLVDCSLQN